RLASPEIAFMPPAETFAWPRSRYPRLLSPERLLSPAPVTGVKRRSRAARVLSPDRSLSRASVVLEPAARRSSANGTAGGGSLGMPPALKTRNRNAGSAGSAGFDLETSRGPVSLRLNQPAWAFAFFQAATTLGSISLAAGCELAAAAIPKNKTNEPRK